MHHRERVVELRAEEPGAPRVPRERAERLEDGDGPPCRPKPVSKPQMATTISGGTPYCSRIWARSSRSRLAAASARERLVEPLVAIAARPRFGHEVGEPDIEGLANEKPWCTADPTRT
jgi:hypothetical protein